MHTPNSISTSSEFSGTQEEYLLLDHQVAIDALADATDYWRNVSRFDRLTELQNLSSWQEGITERIEQGKPFGIFLLDMDKFKTINDNISHIEGDRLLQDFGSTLRRSFIRRDDRIRQASIVTTLHDHEGDDASRLGGDEFAVAVSLWGNHRRGHDIHSRMDESWGYLQQVVHDFVDAQPDKVKGQGFGISFGAAVWDPENPLTLKELHEQADNSMREMKQDTR